MAITHDPIDRALPQVPGTNPRVAPNVSVVPPAPHNGGGIEIVGGVIKPVANANGPVESPRQPRDR
jgi:hypothetical protein